MLPLRMSLISMSTDQKGSQINVSIGKYIDAINMSYSHWSHVKNTYTKVAN
jgi:hypothetical protein